LLWKRLPRPAREQFRDEREVFGPNCTTSCKPPTPRNVIGCLFIRNDNRMFPSTPAAKVRGDFRNESLFDELARIHRGVFVVGCRADSETPWMSGSRDITFSPLYCFRRITKHPARVRSRFARLNIVFVFRAHLAFPIRRIMRLRTGVNPGAIAHRAVLLLFTPHLPVFSILSRFRRRVISSFFSKDIGHHVSKDSQSPSYRKFPPNNRMHTGDLFFAPENSTV